MCYLCLLACCAMLSSTAKTGEDAGEEARLSHLLVTSRTVCCSCWLEAVRAKSFGIGRSNQCTSLYIVHGRKHVISIVSEYLLSMSLIYANVCLATG